MNRLLEKLPGQKFLNAQSMDLRFDVGIDTGRWPIWNSLGGRSTNYSLITE